MILTDPQYRLADGSSRWDFLLLVPAGDVLPYGAVLKLEGAVAGLEAYGDLTVRVTGVISRFEEGNTIVILDSHEPVYPGLTVQAYVGKQSLETLEGVTVIVLTTENGERYVLSSSIDFGQATLIGTVDDLVEIEGYAVPDRTFGGLPVLKENSGQVPPDGIVDSNIIVLDQANEPGLANEMVTGLVTIDKIELAYDSISIDRCPPGATNDPFLSPFLVVQPVWVSAGKPPMDGCLRWSSRRSPTSICRRASARRQRCPRGVHGVSSGR